MYNIQNALHQPNEPNNPAREIAQKRLSPLARLLPVCGLAFVILCEFFISKFIFVQKTIDFSHQEATLYAFELVVALLLFSHMLGKFLSHIRRVANEMLIQHYHKLFVILALCLSTLILLIALMRGTGIQFHVNPVGITGTIETAIKAIEPNLNDNQPSTIRETFQLTLVVAIFLLINFALAFAAIWLSFRRGPEQLALGTRTAVALGKGGKTFFLQDMKRALSGDTSTRL